MEKYSLPMFPLNYLILPGEKKFLHIFEERYKQLLKDCLSNGTEFGVTLWANKNSSVALKKIADFGVSVKILRILKTTEKGETDLIVEGMQVFRVHQHIPVAHPKLYSVAEVEFITREYLTNNGELLDACAAFLQSLKKKPLILQSDKISVYTLAEVLQLDNQEKMQILQSETLKVKENLLMNKVRLENQILQAEAKLDGDFWLN